MHGGESHSELRLAQYYLPGSGHFPQSKCDSAGTGVNETLFALKEWVVYHNIAADLTLMRKKKSLVRVNNFSSAYLELGVYRQ